jgi:single-strand DNA-binding protein
MANLNKVILIGRLTRDPETRAFQNGGMVTKIGFAVTNRKKNSQTGNWEDDPMFIDVEVFNRGETGKLADLVRDRCRKGSQIMIEGKLFLDSWEKDGQKRTKHKIVADNVQLLDPRQDGGGGGEYSGGSRSSAPPAKKAAPPRQDDDEYGGDYGGGGSSTSGGGDDDKIPF